MPREGTRMSNDVNPKESKPPKGWLITGMILMLLAFSSCGVGGVSCVSFASSFADILSGASTVALGETTRLDAASSTGVVVSSSAEVICEGEDENRAISGKHRHCYIRWREPGLFVLIRYRSGYVVHRDLRW
jgi:hypothetical protein